MRAASIAPWVVWASAFAGCSNDRASSPHPNDAGRADAMGAEGDATIPPQSHDAGVDPASTCNPDHPYLVIAWVPPTPMHQGVCTAAQVATYIQNFYALGPFTSGDATCDACLQTDENDTRFGPVITTATSGQQVPAEVNYGGCIATLDGCLAAGCCGDQFNELYSCWTVECDDCSDWQAGGPMTLACTQAANAGECSTERVELTSSCEAETFGPDASLGNCGALSSMFLAWCGP